jgi:hypothetical protein
MQSKLVQTVTRLITCLVMVFKSFKNVGDVVKHIIVVLNAKKNTGLSTNCTVSHLFLRPLICLLKVPVKQARGCR